MHFLKLWAGWTALLILIQIGIFIFRCYARKKSGELKLDITFVTAAFIGLLIAITVSCLS